MPSKSARERDPGPSEDKPRSGTGFQYILKPGEGGGGTRETLARDEGDCSSSFFGPEKIRVNSAMSPLGPAVSCILGRKTNITGRGE